MISMLRCVVCGHRVDVSAPLAWRCPNSTATDRHHVLHLVEAPGSDGAPTPDSSRTDRSDIGIDPAEPNPFVRYGPRLAWWAFARANGMSGDECVALTHQIADGFTVTPFARSAELTDALGPSIWVKDETNNVGGSHKARHLVTILLHLRAAEELGLLPCRQPLAIASCGNAAIAAATLARRADWPIDVFVPDSAAETVLALLDELGAGITVCQRRTDDPAGDPAVHRFREAVESGSVPFSVQGPENAYCLDGGRTIGWELADAMAAAGIHLDRVYVQVGGGALATCVGASTTPRTAVRAVQVAGCAPLVRAWRRIGDRPFSEVAARWSDYMWPWDRPVSAADGILDDETYDWLGVVEAMRTPGGGPVVASEADIGAAQALAARTGIDVSATGTAGLAGLLAELDDVATDTDVAVIFSGVSR